MNKDIREFVDESIKTISLLYEQQEPISLAVEKIYEKLIAGNKLLIFGNGGSAADAQHIAGELVGRFKEERKGLAAIALTTNTSVLTALSNDYDFSRVFARQVESLANIGDILWGISTSGDSKNIIEALKIGRIIGTYNLSLTGRDGGQLKELSDLNINIHSYNTARIQEAHRVVYHIICEIVEKKFAHRAQKN